MFVQTEEEWMRLRSQFATSKILSTAVLIPYPLRMPYAVERGVLGGVFECGWVCVSKFLQLLFVLVGQLVAYYSRLVVGTCQLADVATESILGKMNVGWQTVCTVLDGMI
jgi:hypothetical protein